MKEGKTLGEELASAKKIYSSAAMQADCELAGPAVPTVLRQKEEKEEANRTSSNWTREQQQQIAQIDA